MRISGRVHVRLAPATLQRRPRALGGRAGIGRVVLVAVLGLWGCGEPIVVLQPRTNDIQALRDAGYCRDANGVALGYVECQNKLEKEVQKQLESSQPPAP